MHNPHASKMLLKSFKNMFQSGLTVDSFSKITTHTTTVTDDNCCSYWALTKLHPQCIFKFINLKYTTLNCWEYLTNINRHLLLLFADCAGKTIETPFGSSVFPLYHPYITTWNISQKYLSEQHVSNHHAQRHGQTDVASTGTEKRSEQLWLF